MQAGSTAGLFTTPNGTQLPRAEEVYRKFGAIQQSSLNPEVNAKIDAYIEKNPKEWSYIQSMPRTRTERSLVLQAVQKKERREKWRESVMKKLDANPEMKEAYRARQKTARSSRWIAEGKDGCIARVSFPVATLISEIEAKGELIDQCKAVAGDAFTALFSPVKIYQLVDDFRSDAKAQLPEAKAIELTKLCENEASPRVSFETAKEKTK